VARTRHVVPPRIAERVTSGGAAVSPALSPDIVVGYARGTRVSSDSGLGVVATGVFRDHYDALRQRQ